MRIRDAGSKKRRILVRQNIRHAKRCAAWQLGTVAIDRLRELTKAFGFSVCGGDISYLNGGWYITHAGLLRLAQRRRCKGIRVQQVRQFCDPDTIRWVFKATVYTSSQSKGFAGFGDADPSNVSPLVHGAEMRVAETRAVNRALRKAYGIGLCSVEELGWSPRAAEPATSKHHDPVASGNNGHHNGEHRLRDRLCLLIRQHKLDANLVKAYAADYCGTAVLKEAKRDLVEAFVNDLEERATKDREGLVCHLNSYSTTSQEATT